MTSLRPAPPEELDAVEALLARHGLPTDDVRDGATTFYLAEADGEVVGVGGLERAGSAALLRSVAVETPGRGHGTAIVRALEERAWTEGVVALYLLTDGAAGFFEHLGFERVDRDTAPPVIRATREFEELCGVSAVCLRSVR